MPILARSPAVEAGLGRRLQWPSQQRHNARFWKFDTGRGIFGTGEIETMTSSPYDVHLDGHGNLDTIVLGHGAAGSRDAAWTSARIKTRRLFGAPRGGEMMVTASIRQPEPPQPLGYWPGFWMLAPSAWPTTGEIDILEDVNGLSKTSGTPHCGNHTDRNPDGTTGPCHEKSGLDRVRRSRLLDPAECRGRRRLSRRAVPVYHPGQPEQLLHRPGPGLYDPMTAGDVSPLLNAFEADAVVGSPCPMVDAFRVDMVPEPRAVKLLTALAEVCDRSQDPVTARGALNELSWSLLDCTLQGAPHQALMRSAAMAHQHSHTLGADHRPILEAIEDHADPEPGTAA